jgi:hypothetical protein
MWKLSGFVIAALISCGCSASLPFARAKGLPGSYQLVQPEQVVRLTLNPNGSYTETIHHKNGAIEKIQSQWKWQDYGVTVRDFLIPEGLVPDSLFRSGNTEVARRTAQGTIQFDWSLSPETTLSGKMVLYVNPDRGPAFEKVSNVVSGN